MPDFSRICKRFSKSTATLQDVVRVYQAVLSFPEILRILATAANEVTNEAKKQALETIVREMWLDDFTVRALSVSSLLTTERRF